MGAAMNGAKELLVADVTIPVRGGLPAYLAVPSGSGP
jgi:hypothetical protein